MRQEKVNPADGGRSKRGLPTRPGSHEQPSGSAGEDGFDQSAVPVSDLVLLRRCLALLGGERKLFLQVTAAMLATALLRLPAPLVTMYVIDGVTPAEGRTSLSRVSIACLLLVAILLAARGIATIQRVVLEKFRYRLTFRLQRSLFTHVLKLPLAYHLRHRHGYLMSRVHDDPLKLQGIMADSVLSLLGDAITLAVGVVFLLSIHWKLALVSVLVLPGLVVLFVRLRVSLRGDFKEAQERAAKVSSYLGDVLSKTRTIKALALAPLARRGFVQVMVARIRQRFRILRRQLVYETIIGLLTGLVPVLILWLGAVEILHHRLTVGEFIAFNGYLAYLYRPAEGIVISLLSMQGSLSAVERVLGVLQTDAEPDLLPDETPRTLNRRIAGAAGLEFRGVGFSYAGSPDWSLREVNFSLQPGELVALQGPSGVGKTTLLNLIPRLLVPSEGRITLAGTDCAGIPLAELRQRVTLVSLETHLFGATILDAVTCTGRAQDSNELREALRVACADRFLEERHLRLDATLESEAQNLSAGQRQRLLIARAVLRRPEVLILDEATSFLEADLEREVLCNVRESLGERGLLICVSHRTSLLELADRVLKVGSRKGEAGGTSTFVQYTGIGPSEQFGTGIEATQ